MKKAQIKHLIRMLEEQGYPTDINSVMRLKYALSTNELMKRDILYEIKLTNQDGIKYLLKLFRDARIEVLFENHLRDLGINQVTSKWFDSKYYFATPIGIGAIELELLIDGQPVKGYGNATLVHKDIIVTASHVIQEEIDEIVSAFFIPYHHNYTRRRPIEIDKKKLYRCGEDILFARLKEEVDDIRVEAIVPEDHQDESFNTSTFSYYYSDEYGLLPEPLYIESEIFGKNSDNEFITIPGVTHSFSGSTVFVKDKNRFKIKYIVTKATSNHSTGVKDNFTYTKNKNALKQDTKNYDEIIKNTLGVKQDFGRISIVEKIDESMLESAIDKLYKKSILDKSFQEIQFDSPSSGLSGPKFGDNFKFKESKR